jgi:hypothetical protein
MDFVSMDIKLPSSQEGGRPLWAEHARFLEVLRGVPHSVKVVVAPETGREEVEEAARLVAETNPHTPFLLQPAFSGRSPLVEASFLMECLSAAAGLLGEVRFSIQLHKLLGVR